MPLESGRRAKMLSSPRRWLCRCALLLACCQSGLLLSQTAAPPAASAPALATGPYYALVIGNNNYHYLHKLQTAVNDANAIAQLLRERYGFQTKILLDATRQQILDAIVEYRKDLPAGSNLLIYYAGHGHHDRDSDESYWLPVDAQSDSNANWISADDITRDIKAMSLAEHVLVISDSCYSGYLTRDADAAIDPSEQNAYLEKMMKSKSRTLMSSGGDEPVADGGAPGHSVFASVILESLSQIDQNDFTASYLFQRYVQPAVGGKSGQLPQYNVILNSGHAYGDFVFARQPFAAGSPAIGSAVPSQPITNRSPVMEHTPAESAGSFDGQWLTTVACASYGGALGYSHQFVSVVSNGSLRGGYGTEGEPGSLVIDGAIAPDGKALLSAKGSVGSKDYAVGAKARGTEYGYNIDAHFAGSTGTGERVGGRPCSFKFAKQ